jgi:hypothetical protein
MANQQYSGVGWCDQDTSLHHQLCPLGPCVISDAQGVHPLDFYSQMITPPLYDERFQVRSCPEQEPAFCEIAAS